MLYDELRFRGTYIFKERDRIERAGLVAASFSAWQGLSSTVEKLPKWSTYLKGLGLSNEPKLTKEDLKREANQAMANAQRIIDLAKKGGTRGSR